MGIPENDYEFEKLAHDMALSRVLKKEPISESCETAADIVRELVFLAISHTRVKQDPRVTLQEIFRGVMQAMFALDKDLSQTAVRLLQEIPNLADRLVIDFSSLMTWAMEGIASLAPAFGRENCRKMQRKIDEKFMGAGEIFGKLCSQSRP
jgi:hypothetical protein